MKKSNKPLLLRAVLLIAFSSVFFLSGHAQTGQISITAKNMSIRQFLREIENKSKYTISYREGVISENEKVSISTSNKALKELLNEVLTPRGLSYTVQSSVISIIKNERPVQDLISVNGTITDSNGEPLIGVSISVKGQPAQNSVSDMDGHFRIKATKGNILLFSYIGYESHNERVSEKSALKVVLEEKSHDLNEVVVMGYGVMRKSDLTGSVARVDAKSIANTPSIRVDQALSGKISGMNITNTTGEPGAAPNILIRGGNSISASNSPLYVIDGFVGIEDLNQIDPNDIESIEILKDAASTSIYGSRGANGVILVATKRGAEGKNTISVNAYAGVQQVAKRIEMLNARDYAEMLNMQDVITGQEPSIKNPSLYTQGTNWQDEVLRLALVQNYQLSAVGGTKDLRYYLSASYFDQEGVIKNSGIKRYQTRLNLDRKFGSKVNLGVNFQLSHSQKKPNLVSLGGFDYQNSALAIPPTMTILNPDGTYNADSPSRVVSNKIDNVVAQLNEKEKKESATSVYTALFVNWEIIKNLHFKTSFGLNAGLNSTKEYRSSILPSLLQSSTKGEAWINEGKNYSILWENTVNYIKELAKGHHLTALAGFTMQTANNEGTSMYGKNFTSDLLGWNNLSDSEMKSRLIGSSASEWAILSFLGRVNYSLLDRYLFTLTGRYDGSSRLGRANQYAFFPSAALAWRISEESFMKQFEQLSNLKLRVSYGLSGNQDIALYQTLPVMKQVDVVMDDETKIGYIPERLGNDKLKWETTGQLDIGLEASFFGSRLTLEADYYKKETKDLLLDVEFPYMSGFKNGLMNIGKVSNQGVELMIRSTNIIKKHFSWSTDFNIAHNKNKVLQLGPDKDFEYTFRPGLGTHPYSWLKKGEPVGVFYGHIMDGFYTSREEILAGPEKNASLGQKKYRDINNDGKITIEDQTTIGDPNPVIYGGLGNTFTFGDFSLNIFFQYSYGNDILAGGDFLYATVDPRFVNQYKEVKNFWSLDNPSAAYPKLYSNDEYMPSTYMVHDGSYLKLKTVSLYYNLPMKRWRLGKYLKEFQCYATANNLFTFTKYKGYDPDVNTGVEGGHHVYSANVLRGMDFTAYPAARTFTFGLKITL